jgi:TRAP-type C4-dicarboxylate transport system substrate-binding protein
MRAHGQGKPMIGLVARLVLLAIVLAPLTAAAEPIKLKLAYFTSDRASFYKIAIKPFVDAVNDDARGNIEITTYPGGSLGKDQSRQAQLVRDGVADISFVALGPTGDQFADDAVMQLPGLFGSLREATLVHTRMVASKIVEGYEDFFVIGAFATEPQSIHMRPPVATLEDLKGKRIRANNTIEAAVLAKLGMYPVILPIGKTAEAISRGTIDGATTVVAPLVTFGLGRVMTHHYFVGLGSNVTTILMNRKKFESLPKESQDVIRAYSSDWLVARYIQGFEAYNAQLMQDLKSDPSRKVIFPSQADTDQLGQVLKGVRAEWAAASPRNRQLLNVVKSELGQVRSAP